MCNTRKTGDYYDPRYPFGPPNSRAMGRPGLSPVHRLLSFCFAIPSRRRYLLHIFPTFCFVYVVLVYKLIDIADPGRVTADVRPMASKSWARRISLQENEDERVCHIRSRKAHRNPLHFAGFLPTTFVIMLQNRIGRTLS